MKLSRRNITLSGVATIVIGLLSFLAYELENPGPLIGGVAVIWGSIEAKFHKLFTKKNPSDSTLKAKNLDVLQAKIKYLETKTQYLESKLKSTQKP